MAKNKRNQKRIKLGDIIHLINPIIDVVIWTQYDKEEDGPAWSGPLLNMPWYFLDYEIGSTNNSNEPIDFRRDLGKEMNHREGVVIQLIAG